MRYRDYSGIKLIVFIMAAGLTSVTVHAENLIYNSSFELGDSGYACVKYLRPETNPSLEYEGPVVDPSTFVSGKQSLHIRNRFAEQVRLYVHEVKLNQNTEYTISFWMKSNIKDCQIITHFISASTAKGWDVIFGDFQVGEAWKRYHITFKTAAGKEPYYNLCFILCQGKDAPAADLWLDDLQLNTGALQPYHSAPVEVAAVPEQTLYVKGDSNKSATVNVIAVNHSAEAAKIQIDLNIIADNSGNYPEGFHGDKKIVSAGNLELAPHEKKVIPVEILLNRFGAFHVKPVIDGKFPSVTGDSYFTVIGKYDCKPVDLNNTFCVGLNMGSAGYMYPPHFNELDKPGYRMAGYSPDKWMELLSQMGCRFIRDWDFPQPAFHWRALEPEEGKYDFSISDQTVERANKYNIKVMPVLGEADMICQIKGEKNVGGGLPDWLIKKSTLAKTPEWLKKDGNQVYLPPMESWRKLIRAIAERYKGKITHYEIMNEANLYLEAEVYLGYLKTAYEEIKAIDTDCKVVGFCSTGDLGGNVEGFINNCFKGGGLNYADIVSFHPYDAPNLGAIIAADKQITAVRSLLEKYGKKNYPLWDSELYYLTGKGADYVERERFQPPDAAQRFLTDLGEGVGQSSWGTSYNWFHNPVAPHLFRFILIPQIPNSNYVAYNALARMFEGAKPLDKIRWGSDTICYVYEKDGKYLAAFWNYGEMKGLKLLLIATDNVAQLYDLYGNPLPLKTQPLELTASPYYLMWKGNDRDAFISMLKNAKLDADKPVVPGAVRLLPENGGWVAMVGLRNCTGQEIKGKLGIRGGGFTALNSVDFTIPGSTEQSVKVPVKRKVNDSALVEVKLYANGKLWNFSVPVMPGSVVYPASTVEGKDEPLLKSSKTKTAHQASFRCKYDDLNLYLTISVKDLTPSGIPGERQPWEQDGVELFFDADPSLLPSVHTTAYHDRVGRLFVLPYAPQEQRLTVSTRGLKKLTPENIQLQTDIFTDGYTVKLAIPLQALNLKPPLKGKCIGFDIAVDDADGTKKAEQQLLWNSSGDAYKDRCSFGFIEFE